jgi:hypothetical protein
MGFKGGPTQVMAPNSAPAAAPGGDGPTVQLTPTQSSSGFAVCGESTAAAAAAAAADDDDSGAAAHASSNAGSVMPSSTTVQEGCCPSAALDASTAPDRQAYAKKEGAGLQENCTGWCNYYSTTLEGLGPTLGG